MSNETKLTSKRATRSTVVTWGIDNTETVVTKGYEVLSPLGQVVCFIAKCDVLNEWEAWRSNLEGEQLTTGLTKKEILENIERQWSEGTLYMTYEEFNAFCKKRTEKLATAANNLATKAAEAIKDMQPAAEPVTASPEESPVAEPITKEEIKALLINRKLEISDVIDVIVEVNGFVGVGLITLGEGLKDYTQGLIKTDTQDYRNA